MNVWEVGGLFSGSGGLEAGFELAGFRIRWLCEVESYRRGILKKHFPRLHIYGDIKETQWEKVPRVGVLTGGFPCQDISVAGKRAGIQPGTRSGLWLEQARVINILHPIFVVIENVEGLLSGGIHQVLGDLRRIGYQPFPPILLSARFVGAQHIRRRVFIIAYSDNQGLPQQQPPQKKRQSRVGPDWLPVRQAWPALDTSQAFICRGDDGIPHRMDRIKALGDAVVPQVAEFIAERIKAATKISMR